MRTSVSLDGQVSDNPKQLQLIAMVRFRESPRKKQSVPISGGTGECGNEMAERRLATLRTEGGLKAAPLGRSSLDG